MSSADACFCIDIDNVIACTDEVIRRLISDFTGGRVRLEYEDIGVFNYYECRDQHGNQITKADWKLVHDLFSEPGTVMNIAPMLGALDGLFRLAEHATIHLATSRLPKARKATVGWLEKHGFPEHDLHFLKHREKHEVLRQFTAAVEDDYDQAVAFAVIGKTPCFLIRHPWNRNRAAVEGVQWVKGWSELTPRLMALATGGR